MIREECIYLRTQDDVAIALWKIYVRQHTGKHIFLTHGTFSDRRICITIARYFAKKGYVCWIMEWRNHGKSAAGKSRFDFETIALFDMKAVFSYLTQRLHIRNLHCITHSGGGICLTMFLARNPGFMTYIRSVTLFACQAFSAGISIAQQVKLLAGKYLTRMLGFVPARRLGLGIHNEAYHTMKQWFNWNLSKAFKGNDAFNYRDEMQYIKIPVFAIASAGDQFIAPEQSCKIYLDQFGGPANRYACFSRENGHLEDYGHARVLLSRNAIKEIWPVVHSWIARYERVQSTLHE